MFRTSFLPKPILNQLYSSYLSPFFLLRRQFHTFPPLRSRDNFTKKRTEQTIKDTDNATPKTRSGIRYVDTPSPSNGTAPQTFLNFTANPTSRVIFNNPAEQKQAAVEAERQAMGLLPQEHVKKDKTDAEDLLVVLNRIRVHPVYKFTRVFVVGSSLVLLSNRIREADSLPLEQFDDSTPYLDRIPKIATKTKRIMIATLQRVWSPWDLDKSDDEHVVDYDENETNLSPLQDLQQDQRHGHEHSGFTKLQDNIISLAELTSDHEEIVGNLAELSSDNEELIGNFVEMKATV